MNVLDLFSGVGGFSLGLERAGMRTIAFCEIDPYCREVLRQHWPDVPVFRDVRELTAEALAHAREIRCDRWSANPGREAWCDARLETTSIDVICGGFPCQDISVAGKGAGIDGARSGLWSEYARIIGEVRPRYVIVENVAALLGRGIERVLGDLAAFGFDAEWHCIPASAVGAPHRRDRVWVVAHATSERRRSARTATTREKNGGRSFGELGRTGDVADARCELLERRLRESAQVTTQWLTEPDVGRVAHGVPFRVDRLRSLGNAIVPQIAEIIGRAIMNAERTTEQKVAAKAPDKLLINNEGAFLAENGEPNEFKYL